MRALGLRLVVPALLVMAVTLFHTEVFAQFAGAGGGFADVPLYLKWIAFAGVVILVAIRRLR